jgi:NhaA family Na+:H+ antiporter
LLPLLTSLAVWRFFGRNPGPLATEARKRLGMALWPYVIAGLLSWLGFAASGLPPALGLLPVIPAIPHADRSFGLFAEAEEFLHDPLNRLAHLLVKPMAVVLFLFGLTRGGIDLGAFDSATITTLAALWLGKPLGLLLGLITAALIFRAHLPPAMRLREMVLIAVISGMGFTVPVLALETALPGGGMAEAARLGLAVSLFAGPIAVALGRMLKR